MLHGTGASIEAPQLAAILEHRPHIPWFEVQAESYVSQGGADFRSLAALREHYPLAFACGGLSLGSTDPLNMGFLSRLSALAAELQPETLCDALGWSSVNQRYFHGVLPLPYTEEAVEHVVGRIRAVQDELGRPLLVRNIASYFRFSHSTLREWEFVAAVLEESDCFLALDVSALLLNAALHHFDSAHYLDALPGERVSELRVGALSTADALAPDTLPEHESALVALFADVVARFGPQPTAVTWEQRPAGDLQALVARLETFDATLGAVHELA